MLRFVMTFMLVLGVLFAVELTPPGQAYLVTPWTNFIAALSAQLVKLFDSNVIAAGNSLIDGATGFGVTILAGCNGVEAMIVLTAGMLAFPATAKQRFIGIAIGFVAIQLMNLTRIISLFYIGQWSMVLFEWAHLYIWQILIMLDVLIVWLLWIRYLSRLRGAAPSPAAAEQAA